MRAYPPIRFNCTVSGCSRKLRPQRLRGQLVLKKTVYLHCNLTFFFEPLINCRSFPRMRLEFFWEIVACLKQFEVYFMKLRSFRGKLNFGKWSFLGHALKRAEVLYARSVWETIVLSLKFLNNLGEEVLKYNTLFCFLIWKLSLL